MRITALVKSHEHVCCRYRIAAYRVPFVALGHHFDIRPWSPAWFVRQMFPVLGPGADTLLIQRKLFPAWQLNLMRRKVRRLIFDFDDAVFLRSSYNSRGHDCPKRFARFRHMMQNADLVVAGNEFLREQAAALTDPAKLYLIPTCIDLSRYSLAQHAHSCVKLAWIGSASTLRGLEKIASLLEQLGKSVPQLELKVICNRSLTLHHLPISFCAWNEATETAELADADIGISWLPDDAWSAGKCGLKVLQYMAAGLPVVANPVGMHRKLIADGVSGFLVSTPAQCQEAIGVLVGDADLRRRMGRAGRDIVEAQFQIEHGAAAWQRALQSLQISRERVAVSCP
jgi:glycosyltransferase involved in cell wall biosynthesis